MVDPRRSGECHSGFRGWWTDADRAVCVYSLNDVEFKTIGTYRDPVGVVDEFASA